MADVNEAAAEKTSKGKGVLAVVDVVEAASGEKRSNEGKDNRAREELWLACAGRVEVPCPGELVFYFPQGYIEQIEACVNGEGDSQMPKYDLPYKMLCRVVHSELLAEPYTDEVFAKIDLLHEPSPLHNKEESFREGASSSSSAKPLVATRVFSKKLTPSDTNVHTGLFIPKLIAEGCFPPLDMSKENPVQDIVAKDLHGLEWKFCYAYRGNPRRHLLTSGWMAFVNTKKLVTGDVCFFVRGENDELYIGFRRRTKPLQSKTTAPYLSCDSIKHGLLADAYLALSTKNILTVFYRPWSCPEKFLIPYDEYMKAQGFNYGVETRIKMKYQGSEAYPGEGSSIIAGAVIGIEEVDAFIWPGSEWRCLKVKWDNIYEGMDCPLRVSPWSVKPVEISSKKHMAIPSLNEQPAERGRDFHLHLHPMGYYYNPDNITSDETIHVQEDTFVPTSTKVFVFNQTVGRAVQLASFGGYEELISKLDEMFGFEGTLIDRSSGYRVTFVDAEGHIQLLGDLPWSEFMAIMVRKLYIGP